MLTKHNPASIAKPSAIYSHGVEVSAGSRLLYTAGQIAANPDGTIAKGIEAQVERCLTNILEILKSANMGPENLVKVTCYLTERTHAKPFREVRDRLFGKHAPAETMIVIAELASPEFLVEIEAIAAA